MLCLFVGRLEELSFKRTLCPPLLLVASHDGIVQPGIRRVLLFCWMCVLYAYGLCYVVGCVYVVCVT